MTILYHSFERNSGPRYAVTRFMVGSACNRTASVLSYCVVNYGGEAYRVSKWHEVDL
jgi:hypothetical protein